jgi:hypothetical protein
MRRMTSRLRLLGLVAALALGGGAACNEKTGSDKFVGTWIYAGMIEANCMDIAPLDLTGAMTTITATDSSHIRMDLQGYCALNFEVDGFTANAVGGQSCTLPIPGLPAPLPVGVTSWTLTISSTDVIDSAVVGSVLGCIPTGAGTLTRVGDAGG